MDIQTFDINKIVRELKELKTDEEKFEAIEKIPEEIRIKVLDSYEEVYKPVKTRTNESGIQIISMNNGLPFLFKHIRNLKYQNKLEFFKKLSDDHKDKYFTEYKEEDGFLLDIIKSVKSYACKLDFAQKISSDDLRGQELRNLNVKKSVLYYAEGIGNKDGIYDDEKNIVARKYKKIGLPPEMTFGIEIECSNVDYCKYLIEKGSFFLEPSEQNKNWICKLESTANYYNIFPNTGLECTSRVLNDSKEHTQEIYEVCDFLNDIESTTDERCGGHIHFGRDYLHTPNQLWNLIELYGKCEDVMNLILNEPNSLPRNGLNKYAVSLYKTLMVKGFDPNKFENIRKCIERIQIRAQRNKNFDINVSTKYPTIEFRAPNGTIDPNIWIENIKLLGNLMVVAKGLETGELTNIDEKRELFSQIKSEKSISKKCAMLLDLLFDDEKDKEIYRERFNSNLVLQFGTNEYAMLHSSIKTKEEDNNDRGEI